LAPAVTDQAVGDDKGGPVRQSGVSRRQRVELDQLRGALLGKQLKKSGQNFKNLESVIDQDWVGLRLLLHKSKSIGRPWFWASATYVIL
jgi:hypothetical protein